MTLTIKSNRRWREFVYRTDVPDAILAGQFSHLSEEDALDGFFSYRGHWYHTSDFMACPPVTKNPSDPFVDWDGYHGDSYFSGVVIKLSRDGESYKIGTYFS